MILIHVILIILIMYYCYLIYLNYLDKYVRTEEMVSTDWSSDWTDLDFKARENRDCKPIKKIYENLNSIESWIYTVPSSCENGLPHTRNHNVIALPNDLSLMEIPSVLRHEKIHLNQRLYKNKWREFYRKYWNYEIFVKPHDKMPNELITMKRANPDTNDAPFARWNNKWWSVPVYKSSDDLEFRNCVLKWWNEETNELKSDPPKEWIDFFGPVDPIFTHISAIEHPHEISATYLSNENISIYPLSIYSIYDYLMNKIIYKQKSDNTLAKKILLDQWNMEIEQLK